MNKRHLISIIIPAYNSAGTIHATIESVLNQTFTNFELIIVDDGSTDDTAQIVRRFQDERLVYIYQPNSERSAARNNGIAHAKGHYIAFLDSDDLWLPTKLEKQIMLMEGNPDLGLVYCDMILFDSYTARDVSRHSQLATPHRGRVPLRDILVQNFISSPTPLVRRQVFEQVGGFDTTLVPCEDWDMWIRVVARFTIDYIPEPLARYRLRSNYTSWENKPGLMFDQSTKVLDKVEENFVKQGLCPASAVRKGRSRIYYLYGRAMMYQGNFDEAHQYYLHSLRLDPFEYKTYLRLIQLVYRVATKSSHT